MAIDVEKVLQGAGFEKVKELDNGKFEWSWDIDGCPVTVYTDNSTTIKDVFESIFNEGIYYGKY